MQSGQSATGRARRLLTALALLALLGRCALAAPGASGARRVIVKLKSGEQLVLTAAQAAALGGGSNGGEAAGGEFTRSLGAPPPGPLTLEATLELLNARSDIQYAQEDFFIFPQRTPDDALFDKEWGLQAVGAPAAWDLSVGNLAAGLPSPAASSSHSKAGQQPGGRNPQPAGNSSSSAGLAGSSGSAVPVGNGSGSAMDSQGPLGMVTVCVVDSGIDTAHPQLSASMHPLQGINVINASAGVADGLGHGTHISGILAAAGNDGQQVAGVTWGASAGSLVRLLACKFIADLGWGYTSGAVTCIEYCLDQKADIISASWSAGSQSNPALEAAVAQAGQADVLFVAAAGNYGASLSAFPTYPAAYGLTHPHVLTVGSSGPQGDWVNGSSYDPQGVHLSAPGVMILSTWPGGFTEYSSGTSMAVPFVSGAAALLVAASGRRVTPLQARGLLLRSVQKLESHRGMCSSGGRLRIDRALRRALGLAPPDRGFRSPPPSRPPPPPPPPQRLAKPPGSGKRRPPPPRRRKHKPPPPPRRKKKRPHHD